MVFAKHISDTSARLTLCMSVYVSIYLMRQKCDIHNRPIFNYYSPDISIVKILICNVLNDFGLFKK